MRGEREERIDFSAIDPSRDEERWERMIAAVGRRGRAAASAGGVLGQVAAWWRPALAAAAALVLAIAGAGLLAGREPQAASAPGMDPDAALVRWALGDGGGSAWDELALIGGDDGQP
jgi:hypothetical protein